MARKDDVKLIGVLDPRYVIDCGAGLPATGFQE